MRETIWRHAKVSRKFMAQIEKISKGPPSSGMLRLATEKTADAQGKVSDELESSSERCTMKIYDTLNASLSLGNAERNNQISMSTTENNPITRALPIK